MNHISPTQINMYLRCPAQYYFRYCQDIKIPPKSAIIKGRAVHKGQEHNYKQKIETKEDLPLDVVQDIVADTFEQEAQEAIFEPDEDKGKVKDETINLASLYHNNISPLVQPEYVEQTVEIQYPDFTLLGIIDVADINGVIRDTKTTARTPNQDVIEKSLQLTAYSLAYRTIKQKDEQKVVLDYLVSTKQPKIVTLEAQKTEKDIERFIKITRSIVHAIKNEIFYPNTENYMCNPNACGYWEMCKKEF